MLKTNSKKARENVRAWIRANYNGGEYDYPTAQKGDGVAEILATLKTVFAKEERRQDFAGFKKWLFGLPGIIEISPYHADWRATVAQWLDETQKEANKYDNDRVANAFALLIYREIERG